MDNSQNKIELRQLLNLFHQHWHGIVISTFICAIVGFILAAFVIPPQYEATTQILVNQRHVNSAQSYNVQQTDTQMVNTYKEIITNPVILNEASHQLAHPQELVRKARPAKYRRNADGTRKLVRAAKPAVYKNNGKAYNISPNQLKEMLSVQTQQNSQVFSLTAKTNSAEEAAAVVNAVTYIFQRKITKMMSVNNVTIVSRAQVPSSKSFPKDSHFFLGGALVGLVVSMLLIIIRDLTNTTVRDDSFLTDELGLSDLGQISHYHMRENSQRQENHQSSNHKRV